MKIERCVRCGADISNSEQCSVCGVIFITDSDGDVVGYKASIEFINSNPCELWEDRRHQ